ncbi:MAG TPA: ATP-binding cassette domain-containing protein, partial [Candidatus Kapabacteria bacterium]|nr:ATP-binding cassette domain-containing protein [Candidatus Kapabacteria bacterium]
IRFYDPQKGTIQLDGKDIKDFTLESYRSLFGVVSQESILFNDTIANNIRLASPLAEMSEVIRVAKIAHAHDFISSLPEGYNTYVGDRGMLLSGGQKQRIAIARALLHRPEIVIFDEATSALDSVSELAVQEAINDILSHQTAIIIAHRLSTIVDCDCIYVFDDGKIVESGTHTELIEKKGTYKHLYDIQFSS